MPLASPEINHVMVCDRWDSFGHACLIQLNLSMYSLTFSLDFILMVLSLRMGLSKILSVPNRLQKALSKLVHVSLSASSMSKNQSATVLTKASGNSLSRSILDPSLFALQASLYQARYLVGSSLPL